MFDAVLAARSVLEWSHSKRRSYEFAQLWVNRVFLLSDRRKPGHRILRKVELTGCGDRDRALNTWFRWFIAGTQPHLVR